MYKILDVNKNGCDFVVGDLHGCFDLLEKGLEFLKFDPAKDRVISVGDLVDRGPKNMECLRLLNEPWFFAVAGNHEELLLDAFNKWQCTSLWVRNGGGWDTDDNREELKVLLEIVKQLPRLITVPLYGGSGFHVVHAELSPVNGERITNESLAKNAYIHCTDTNWEGLPHITWGRHWWNDLYGVDLSNIDSLKLAINSTLFNRGRGAVSRINSRDLWEVYSGHTPVREPTRIANFINIDTCGFRSLYRDDWGGLTIAIPENGNFIQVTNSGVKEVNLRMIV